MDRYDLIVVGLGAMGAAVLRSSAERGLRVLGIDRYRPPHPMGSTHAETRITRLAVGEGPEYLPFVRRSHEIWRELENRTGERLLYETGGLIITNPTPVAGQRWEDFVTRTAEIAAAGGIRFEQPDPAEIMDRYPVEGLDGLMVGHEPTGGIVMAERAVALHASLAESAGAEIRTGEVVADVVDRRAIATGGGAAGVEVVTDRGRYRADRVVVATGPWLPELAPGDADLVRVTRQVVYWFEAEDLSRFEVGRFPFLMWVGDSDEEYLGVFPIPPGGTRALKVLGEQFVDATTPDRVERQVSSNEVAEFHRRMVAPRLDGVGARCVKADVCLYTNTPDDHFLIDEHPRSDRVIVMSPCSGHGFKHSAALGEAVAGSVAGDTPVLDLSPFRRDRRQAYAGG